MNRNGRRQLHRSVGLTTWERAAALSTQANDSDGNIRSQINQAQALQELGLYRRSIARLISLTQTLQDQPHQTLQAIAPDHCG